MTYLEIFLVGLGLAMDAFAVSICKGVFIKKMNIKKCLLVATYFGIFQGLMPVIGYYLGISFDTIITEVDHYIAFTLLIFIGIGMLFEAFNDDKKNRNNKLDFKTMIILSIATSIDALAVGVSFAFLKVNIFSSSFIIFITTFILCFFGVKIGNIFGNKYERKSQIFGGIVLIAMAIKILVEHLV